MPYQADARHHWFDAHAGRTAEVERLLCFAGWLMAQSAYNRSSLQVSVPVLLFRRLVEGQSFAPSLPLLAEFDAATAAGTPQTLEPRTRPEA